MKRKVKTTRAQRKNSNKLINASKKACSYKDISEATGMTVDQIRTTLKDNPKAKALILKNVKENKQQKVSESDISTIQQDLPENSKFVLDTSMCGTQDLGAILNTIFKSNGKVIITSIVLKELVKLQKKHISSSFIARHILGLAAEYPELFISVLIDESLQINDDNIINYCIDNKQDVCLLASDKEMSIKARMYGVKVYYFKHTNSTPIFSSIDLLSSKDDSTLDIKESTGKSSKKDSENEKNSKENAKPERLFTLPYTTVVDNELYIYNPDFTVFVVRVIRKGIEQTGGKINLKEGDIVYIIDRVNEYLRFRHFNVISQEATNNSKCVYARLIGDSLKNIPTCYLPFIKYCLSKNFCQQKVSVVNNNLCPKIVPKGKKDSPDKFPIELPFIRSSENGLIICNFITPTSSRMVLSKSKKYNSGIFSLSVGDEIYVAIYRKKKGYISFRHYKVISTSSQNNCQLIFHKRFYGSTNDLNDSYKDFIYESIKSHNWII